MAVLETLPNIGKVLAARLRAAGIETDAELLRLGDAAAFRRIRAALPADACTHTRLALAGAARGVRWHDLDAGLRAKLTREALGD
jgi:DNA transformation protein